MAALLVLLFLLVGPLTMITANDIYYVTAFNSDKSCPPHQMCHNLSYYVSQPESYFTSNTTIIFLEGEHSFNTTKIYISEVHNLTLKGQGQWPITGAEETVMQSTVIISCGTEGGGFFFDKSHNITVEGLTVVNCNGYSYAVFNFHTVKSLNFQMNSIQNMPGYGVFTHNCQDTIITNCSFYHSLPGVGGGVGIRYRDHNSDNNLTLELSYSNMTKCSNDYDGGGGIFLQVKTYTQSLIIRLLFRRLILTQNKGHRGGGLIADLRGNGNGKVTLIISNSVFSRGSAKYAGGGIYFDEITIPSNITIENTTLMENKAPDSSEMHLTIGIFSYLLVLLTFLSSTIIHTETSSNYGVQVSGCCANVTLIDTNMKFANLSLAGFLREGISAYNPGKFKMIGSQIEGCQNAPKILHFLQTETLIANSRFFNNTSKGSQDKSVIEFYHCKDITISNSTISDNNMTGITLIESNIRFSGHNVIQKNRNIEGAGIYLQSALSHIIVDGKLMLYNNTADKQGGAILVMNLPVNDLTSQCTLNFVEKSSLVIFSGNRAGKGGSDIYGAIMNNCYMYDKVFIPHVGQPNETSWYFNTSLKNNFHFSNTDKLSSMSSDPVMICFCNTSSNLPDCSHRTQHIQAYPGVEFNTSIATVGYYGGTSPGVVQVSAQHATLVRTYGQNETTNCFQLHILLQNNATKNLALVDIKLKDVNNEMHVSIKVDMKCPIGFVLSTGACHCDKLLQNNHVECTISATPYKFVGPVNSWFTYVNDTQCITGTINCPFDYCNRFNVSFDIMAPDRQCVANREGTLCGRCRSHLSIMLGSNRCGACSNWYLFLLPVFILAGIVLVSVLMHLNFSVSVGTINGLLFYANIVKLNEAFFFPNGSVPIVSQFISWLNLDLGIEVCLFDGLDGYMSTWLQFAFPAYLFLLMGGIIIGCHYSVWLCRLCGSHTVPALATLFLMSYTKILLTVTNALSITQLPCNDSILTVWSVDGNIEYGSSKHLILVVFSCGVLVIGLAYPVLVLCAPLLERYSHKCIPNKLNLVAKFKPLFDAYGGPYKDRYRFWTGVTLTVRLILTVTFSFTVGRLVIINAFIIITVVMGILTFTAKGVYKKFYMSLLEAFYLINIFVLSTVSLAIASLGSRNCQIATIISVSLSLMACLATMAMHLWYNFIVKKIKNWIAKTRSSKDMSGSIRSHRTVENDSRPPVSPPSVVYGSFRGQHRFLLKFPNQDSHQDSLSDLAREPLLFDD